MSTTNPDVSVPDATTWAEADISAWKDHIGTDLDGAAKDLGLGIVAGVVSVLDSSDQAKKNRNRAKAILGVGGI